MEKIYALEDNFLISYLERRENMKAEEIKAAFDLFGKESEDDEDNILSIDGDTAKIKIEGPLSRTGPDYIDRYLGYSGTGYDDIAEALDEVAATDSIKKVKLYMDTPGGEVSGVDNIFNKIMNIRASKRCTAMNCGMIASAGYWIASACHKIYATSPLNQTGSIGIMMAMVDRNFTKIDNEAGYHRVRIVSKNAPDKAPDLSKAASRKPMQDLVDAMERCMIQSIATGRGISTDTIIGNYGQGAMMIARDPNGENDALGSGLIDGIIDAEDENEEFAESTGSPSILPPKEPETCHPGEPENCHDKSKGQATKPAGAGKNNEEVITMTLKELLAANPAAQIEYDAAIKAAEEKGKIDGATAVRADSEYAATFLGPDSVYPGKIKAIACDVVAGKKSKETLETIIASFDALKEANASAAAQTETTTAGETRPQPDPDITADGQIRNDPKNPAVANADFNAEVARMKKAEGIQ